MRVNEGKVGGKRRGREGLEWDRVRGGRDGVRKDEHMRYVWNLIQ